MPLGPLMQMNLDPARGPKVTNSCMFTVKVTLGCKLTHFGLVLFSQTLKSFFSKRPFSCLGQRYLCCTPC